VIAAPACDVPGDLMMPKLDITPGVPAYDVPAFEPKRTVVPETLPAAPMKLPMDKLPSSSNAIPPAGKSIEIRRDPVTTIPGPSGVPEFIPSPRKTTTPPAQSIEFRREPLGAVPLITDLPVAAPGTSKTAPVVVPNRNTMAPNSLVAPPAVNLPPAPDIVIPDLSRQP